MIIALTSRYESNNQMAEALLQRNVRVKRIITIDQKTAQEVGDPVRLLILEALGHKHMTAEELRRVLGSAGQKKATTTIRHHLDALKSSGLIEATKLVEVRGAVMKFYAPTVRTYDFELPSKLDETHAKLIQDTSTTLLRILRRIHGDKRFLADFSKNTVPCSMCKGNHFREYAAMEIINHALAKASVEKDYAELVSADKESRTTNVKA